MHTSSQGLTVYYQTRTTYSVAESNNAYSCTPLQSVKGSLPLQTELLFNQVMFLSNICNSSIWIKNVIIGFFSSFSQHLYKLSALLNGNKLFIMRDILADRWNIKSGSQNSLFPHLHLKWPCCCCLVTKSCLTLCNSMDCSLPDSSLHEILQTRVLEWVAIPFSRVSSRPRDWTQGSWIAGRIFTIRATREAP